MQNGPPLPRAASLVVGIPLALFAGLVGLVLAVALVFSGGAQGCGTGSSGAALGEVDGTPVPAKLKPLYAEASEKYELGQRGPSILASINWNETGFGTNMGQPPGAMGWMSFLPESWTSFGLDGDGDGDRDPFDPADAIHAAAHLLSITGAPKDWREALYSYNHSNVYVDDVLTEAEEIAGSASAAGGAGEASSECIAFSGAPNEVVAKMVAEADRLSRMRPRTEYVWGGSHGESPISPDSTEFDCSSAVSFILQRGGLKNPTLNTEGFAGWGEPGRGRWVTLHNKPFDTPGGPAHILLEFHEGVTPPSKRFWGTSGFSWFGGHGPGWIPESTFDAGYLSEFELRHPPGL
ncbi:MAG: lytic transglycosylase domain-containing protein [Solirubrobacterales bacterium]